MPSLIASGSLVIRISSRIALRGVSGSHSPDAQRAMKVLACFLMSGRISFPFVQDGSRLKIGLTKSLGVIAARSHLRRLSTSNSQAWKAGETERRDRKKLNERAMRQMRAAYGRECVARGWCALPFMNAERREGMLVARLAYFACLVRVGASVCPTEAQRRRARRRKNEERHELSFLRLLREARLIRLLFSTAAAAPLILPNYILQLLFQSRRQRQYGAPCPCPSTTASSQECVRRCPTSNSAIQDSRLSKRRVRRRVPVTVPAKKGARLFRSCPVLAQCMQLLRVARILARGSSS